MSSRLTHAVPGCLRPGRYGEDPVSPGAPPSSDRSGPSPGPGPVDVAPKVILAARAGDPAAFARFVEHWDGHLRRFVHLTLCAPGQVDQVLAAAYVRAYRAMPTYRADHRPGLWLHRVAYLTVADHLRRQERRGPNRPRNPSPELGAPDLPRTWSPEPDPGGRDLDEAVLATSRRLALDQRGLVVLVDASRFGQAQVASAFEADPEMVRRRLGAARADLADLAAHLPTGARARVGDDPARLSRAVLTAVRAPEPGPSFWSDLGRRLLAEQERPAAPTPDPGARLARAHPSEPGFRPSGALGSFGTSTVLTPAPVRRHEEGGISRSLEPRRELEPEPRNWRRPLLWAGLVVGAVAVLVAAVLIGTSSRTPDGSVTGRTLAENVTGAFTSSRHLSADVEVETLDPAGDTVTQPYRITISDDGSWAAATTDRIDVTAYDVDLGMARRVVVDTPEGADPTVLASEVTGLAPGGPDPVAQPIDVINDLRSVGPLMRSRPDDRAPSSTDGDERRWTFERTAPTGVDGATQRWRIAVDRTDHLPRSIEVHQGAELVRRVRIASWEPRSEVPDGTFAPVIPDDAIVERAGHGFLPVDLAGVEILGRGPAITPAWLPEGFELTRVVVRGDPPPGSPSTAGGTNPPDAGIMSLGYQRGPERITVTVRSAADPSAWRDPFSTPTLPDVDPAGGGAADVEGLADLVLGRPSAVADQQIGDGRFNGAVIHGTVDGAGRARVWGTAQGLLFTVAGDLSTHEARQVVASMR